MTPPVALNRESRFGERANQARAVPAASAQTLSMARASTMNTRPSSASCSGIDPAW